MTTATSEPPGLDAIEHECEARIADLRARRQALSLDALSNKGAAKELVSVERELVAAEDELVRLGLARAEQDRRDAEARERAAAEARAAALDKARQLGEERLAVAQRIDEMARAFAAAVADHREIVAQQNVQVEVAGRRVPDVNHLTLQRALEHALAKALGDAGVRALIDLPPLQVREIKPFAEGDPAPRFENNRKDHDHV